VDLGTSGLKDDRTDGHAERYSPASSLAIEEKLSAVSYRPDGFALPVRALDHFLTSDLSPLTSLICLAPWENVGPLGKK
jgi:hypothetical protein